MLKMVSQLLIFFSVVGDDNTYGLICVSTLSFSLYFRFVLWSLLLTLSFLLYKKSLYYTLYISWWLYTLLHQILFCNVTSVHIVWKSLKKKIESNLNLTTLDVKM